MTPEAIERAFTHLSDEYKFRKALSEKSVQEWRWSTSPRFDPRPLHFERMGHAPGRQLRREPPDRNGRVCCGIDEQNRVVVEMEFNEFGFYETFYNWTTRPVQAAHYDYAPEKKAINLLFVDFVDGRAVSSETSAIHGFSREQYEWSGDRVVTVLRDHAKRECGRLDPVARQHVTTIEYDADGKVLRIVDKWPPSPLTGPTEVAELIFERRGRKIYRRTP
jgi:hypothetical protein